LVTGVGVEDIESVLGEVTVVDVVAVEVVLIVVVLLVIVEEEVVKLVDDEVVKLAEFRLYFSLFEVFPIVDSWHVFMRVLADCNPPHHCCHNDESNELVDY
jgi:hypothetical protein